MFGECHAHMIMDGRNYREAVEIHRQGVQEAVIRSRFMLWKEKGVTFIRDGGDALGVSRRAKDLALDYGIDYRTPVFAIHKKGHYGGIVGKAFSNPKEYRELVREAKREGADFIKIMVSGLMDFSAFGILSEEGLEPEEIRYMIQTAHEEGMAVMAHANGDRQVRAAVEAGVDTIEHGAYLSQETLHILADSAVVWVPTLAPTGNLLGCGRFPDQEVGKILKEQMEHVAAVLELGGHIGLGSDAGAYLVPHGQGLLDEYAYLRQAVKNKGRLDACLKESEEQIKRIMKR